MEEVPLKYFNKVAKCPKCRSENRVVDTIDFSKKLIDAYSNKQKELKLYQAHIIKLKNELSESISIEQIESIKEEYDTQIGILKQNHIELEKRYSSSQNKIKTLEDSISNLKDRVNKDNSTHVDNISQDEEYTSISDYSIVTDWFAKNNIAVEVDEDAIDTRGFFDEVAITLGNNFDTLESVLEQIRFIQRKGYDTVKISLEKKSAHEIEIIKRFCQELYDYSFVARYFLDKKKNAIYIELQKAKKIVNFFNGLWMEWYVYMMLLSLFDKQELPSTLLRGLKITHPNRDKNELDIFFVIGDVPIVIECKSGEFRRDIDKYIILKKRLRLSKKQFIICAIGLDGMHTDGLTNTYDITFKNQNNLIQYIEEIIVEAKAIETKKRKILDGFTVGNKQQNINPPPVSKNDNETIKKAGFLKGFISSFKKS